MVQEAEKHRAEDEQNKRRIEAKNSLENYIFSMRNTVNDPQVGGKLDPSDKSKIEDATKNMLEWLDSHPNETREVYESKLKEIESTCSPIIAKMYQQAGGMPGAAGGFPGAGADKDASSKGPTVEEVD
eukprot:GEZU01011529.1.p2 GENE.GEZU01011529.1~~GEZU01011529.1.p2  ORF type:complete len:128 (-),score=60.03 GEZU01011529.1:62-445(-)